MFIIPIKTIILLAFMFIVTYVFYAYIYRHWLHPEYRWYQIGNVCHEYRRNFSLLLAIITDLILISFSTGIFSLVWQ